MSKFLIIGGTLGVGKSTVARNWAKEHPDFCLVEETVEGHPCLKRFYESMAEWEKGGKEGQYRQLLASERMWRDSFRTQIAFLSDRWQKHNSALISGKSIVADRSIFEDSIFADILRQEGKMDEVDYWKIYRPLYDTLCGFLKAPDLLVFLEASTDTLISRRTDRGRDMEKAIPREYMDHLNTKYMLFAGGYKNRKLIVNTEDMDFREIEGAGWKRLSGMIMEELEA